MAIASNTAIRTRGWRNNSKLGLRDSLVSGRTGNERNEMVNMETRFNAPNNANTARIPIGSSNSPPNSGPATKPSSSTAASRPSRSPRRSGSTWAMSARTAGNTKPNEEPITARARMNCGSELPVAISSDPNAPIIIPAMISRFV